METIKKSETPKTMKNKLVKRVQKEYNKIIEVPTEGNVELSVQLSRAFLDRKSIDDEVLFVFKDHSGEEDVEMLVPFTQEQTKTLIKALKKSLKRLKNLKELKVEINQCPF